jgi:hypothetical protein
LDLYHCLCFALDLEEQKQSRFYYQYSNYQVEYSRNLLFEIGGQMDQVFQALIDRSRVLLDLKTSKPSWATSTGRNIAGGKADLPNGK